MTSNNIKEALQDLDKALDPETTNPWVYVDNAHDLLASEVEDET